MVDDNLIQQLKTFITKNYKLVGEPASEEATLPSFGGKPPGNLVQGAHLNHGSFEDIAATLAGLIRKERKSETFSTMLDKLRQEKGMTPAQLYDRAGVKKQLYSKIMGERNYHPSKNTVIAFSLSLRLRHEETDELLECAGYRFSNSSIADLVILFCIENGLYDLHDVNALLLSVDQKVLYRE
jgi:transcriptional regulator with XRE-family HTH domain